MPNKKLLWLYLVIFPGIVIANTEKTIFRAPEMVQLPSDASIDNLYLISLNDRRPSARALLHASFPNRTHPRGTETWLLLEDLIPGQRYEVRVCWLATQPTEFWLYTHTLSNALYNSDLISSLSLYAASRRALLSAADAQLLQSYRREVSERSSGTRSVLFLQIFAAAEYFTLDGDLMSNVPPVLADIILDRYLLNIFPRSLVPTAVYIVLLAIFAWPLSRLILFLLRTLTVLDSCVDYSEMSNPHSLVKKKQ